MHSILRINRIIVSTFTLYPIVPNFFSLFSMDICTFFDCNMSWKKEVNLLSKHYLQIKYFSAPRQVMRLDPTSRKLLVPVPSGWSMTSLITKKRITLYTPTPAGNNNELCSGSQTQSHSEHLRTSNCVAGLTFWITVTP